MSLKIENATAFSDRQQKGLVMVTRKRHYFLWYITTGGWLVNAGISVHKHQPGQAVFSLAIALVSLFAAVMWRREAKRSR